jgi:IMP dehydrogenase
MKRNAAIRDGLDFKDVLLVPQETAVKPDAVSVKSRVSKDITINIPLISAGLDNITESDMAITLAQLGGIGIIHNNIPLGKQVEEVRRVKRAQGDIISNPITIAPDSSIAEALDLMTTYRISGLPVIDQQSQKVVGIITHRDIRFFEDYAKPVSELMTKKVITVKEKIQHDMARRLMHQHRIEKLVVVDDQDRCTGLITVSDIEKLSRFPDAARDNKGRLRVAAAVSLGKEAVDRAVAMADAGLDVVFVDVAHAHSREAAGTVSVIRQQRSSVIQVVAGNVATGDAARSMIDAGADGIKIGIGSTKNSASRTLAGVGIPPFSAILDIIEVCEMAGVPLLTAYGVLSSADLAKAIGAGADAAVIHAAFAGTDQAPGHIAYHNNQAYKIVNPAAKTQHRPSISNIVHDPYQLDEDAVDTSIPYRGSVTHVIKQMIDGLKIAMAYSGGKDIATFKSVAEFRRIG